MVDVVPHVPGKARTIVPGPLRVQVDARWWAELSSSERAAVLAHECAHHQPGCANGVEGAAGCPTAPRACEACADRRAGAILRAWGVSLDSVRAAFLRVIHSRPDAADDAAEGWKYADKNA